MYSNLGLSALMLATVHSFSISVRSDNTSAVSVGAGDASSIDHPFSFAELLFRLESGIAALVFALEFCLDFRRSNRISITSIRVVPHHLRDHQRENDPQTDDSE